MELCDKPSESWAIRELTAWCHARPPAETLDIASTYDELRRLDSLVNLLILRENERKGEEETDAAEACEDNGLPETSKQAILHTAAYETRLNNLRLRTLELSRKGLRLLKITDLPSEILGIAFDEFQDAQVVSVGECSGLVNWNTTLPEWGSDEAYSAARNRREILGNLRLVCRLFYKLATPLLFSTLVLRVSRTSLEIADRISRNPDMAAGVRGVAVSLAYWPQECTQNVKQYISMRLSNLRRDYWSSDTDSHGDVSDPNNHIIRFQEEWSEYLRRMKGGADPGEPRSKEQEILVKGYADFCRFYEDHQQLLQNRHTFTAALASAIARMPNARSLIFCGEWHMVSLSGFRSGFDWIRNDEANMLSRYMANPMSLLACEWASDGAIHPDSGIRCMKLLWSLPITLYHAGIRLAALSLRCLPLRSNFSLLHPHDDAGTPAWDDLAAACAELQVVSCRMSSRGSFTRLHNFAGAGKKHIDKFFGTIMSHCGPHMRVLDLDCFRLLMKMPHTSRTNRVFHADQFITKLGKLPRLRILSLSDVDLQEKAMTALCGSIGNSLMSVEINRVTLHNGGWAGAMDILHEKTAGSAHRGRRWSGKVSFSSLRGGEFGDSTDGGDIGKSPLEEAVEGYIKGTLALNPLRLAAEEPDNVSILHHPHLDNLGSTLGPSV